MCVYVCEREKERERVCVHSRVCVCVCMRLCMYVNVVKYKIQQHNVEVVINNQNFKWLMCGME